MMFWCTVHGPSHGKVFGTKNQLPYFWRSNRSLYIIVVQQEAKKFIVKFHLPEPASKVQRVGRILWHGRLNQNEGAKGPWFVWCISKTRSLKLISHFLFATFEISNASLLTKHAAIVFFNFGHHSPGVAVASARNDQTAGSCTRSTSRLVIEIPQVGEMELLPVYHHVFMIVYLSFNKLQ